MSEQKKVNHWKQGDYKHLTAGKVVPVVDLLLFWHRLWKGKLLVFL
jgi:hypothetical protein